MWWYFFVRPQPTKILITNIHIIKIISNFVICGYLESIQNDLWSKAFFFLQTKIFIIWISQESSRKNAFLRKMKMLWIWIFTMLLKFRYSSKSPPPCYLNSPFIRHQRVNANPKNKKREHIIEKSLLSP